MPTQISSGPPCETDGRCSCDVVVAPSRVSAPLESDFRPCELNAPAVNIPVAYGQHRRRQPNKSVAANGRPRICRINGFCFHKVIHFGLVTRQPSVAGLVRSVNESADSSCASPHPTGRCGRSSAGRSADRFPSSACAMTRRPRCNKTTEQGGGGQQPPVEF